MSLNCLIDYWKTTTQKTEIEKTTYVPYSRLVKEDEKMAAKKKVNGNKSAAVKKAPANKAASKKSTAKKKVAANKDKGPSKSELAIAIFKKHYGKKERKEIIALFQSEAGLTKAGSNTYYANIKRKHEDGDL